MQDAQHAVNECLDEYNAMLNQLDDAKKAEVMRSMGMKMEQVRASRRVPPCWPPGWKEILRSGGCSVKRRAFVCQEFERLEGEGWYLVFLDESYINVGHSPKKHWHDTTVHTAKEALEKGLSTGTIRPPGRGERLILIGNLIFFNLCFH